VLKQLAIRVYPQLPALRAALENGKWREIQPFAKVIGWKAAMRLWLALRLEKGQPVKRLAKITMRGYRFPLYFRPGGSDPHVIKQVFLRREYEPVGQLPRVTCIVDCGANIGCTTFYLLHRYPEAKAIVIEPDAGNMAVCRRNLRPFLKRVTFLQTGVWPRRCPLIIERGQYRDGAEWSFQVREAFGTEQGDLRAVTIPEAMLAAGFSQIDLLKVDIEGAESELFGSSTEWINKIRNIAIETHGDQCENAVRTALSAFDYEAEISGELTIFKNLTRKSQERL